MKNKIILITGYSASGKDTVCKLMEKNCGYKNIISTTTRPIRDGEVDGENYYFTTKDNFEKSIENDEFIEYREYNTILNGNKDKWYYGVKKNQIENNNDTNVIAVLDIIGLRGFKKYYNENIISFFIHVDDEIRKNRCYLRGDFDELEWERRLKDDKEKYPFEIISKEVDFIIDGVNSPTHILNNMLKLIEIKSKNHE